MPFFHPATPVGKISGSRKLVAKQIPAIESGVPQLQIVGAHVQIEGYGNSWYIVPLCQADNMRSGTFRAFGPFVPVNSTNPIIW